MPREGEGLVHVTASLAGEALVRDARGAAWRLAWTRDGARRFALPTGAYAWSTYRLVAGAWHVSATGAPLARVEVRAGAPVTIAVDAAIVVRLRGARDARDARDVHAEVELAAPAGGGLSVYRDGRRITLEVAALDDAGRPLGSGPVSYG